MADPERAKAIVAAALLQSPSDSRLSELKENMATRQPGEPVFSFSVNFNFED